MAKTVGFIPKAKPNKGGNAGTTPAADNGNKGQQGGNAPAQK